MSIELPLPRRQTPFGLLSDPKIPLVVRTLAGDRTYRFLVDTGADLSVTPRYLAQQVGLDWPALPPVQAVGIGHGGVTGRLGQLPIRLGSVDLSVRCLFLDMPHAPFILGRADFLERFALTVDLAQGKIRLTEVP